METKKTITFHCASEQETFLSRICRLSIEQVSSILTSNKMKEYYDPDAGIKLIVPSS